MQTCLHILIERLKFGANLEQIWSKFGANWEQIGSKLGANWEQIGSKLEANWEHIWSNFRANLEQHFGANLGQITAILHVQFGVLQLQPILIFVFKYLSMH
jgi:hypothetical protein